MPIDSPRKEYLLMNGAWVKCRDVVAGQDAIKVKNKAYLPKLGGQTEIEYQSYLFRASFYNGTARTKEGLVGLVFYKDPDIKVPVVVLKKVEDQLQDVSLDGVALNDFGLQVLDEIIAVGRYGMLLDMQDEETPQAERRPYWVGYQAEDIVNWRVQKVDGKYKTVLVVLRESQEDANPSDPYAAKTTEQYRKLELIHGVGLTSRYRQTVWRKEPNKATSYVQVGPDAFPTRRGQSLDFIPFVPIHAGGITWDVRKPPLLDMVEVNLSHYLTSADLEWGAHWTGLPTPWGVGFPAAMKGKSVPLGPTAVWQLEGQYAKAGMLEFTGQGLQSLSTLLDRKEEQMASLGSRLIEHKSRPAPEETAESVKARNASTHASLRTMAGAVSLALTTMLRWHVWWAGFDVKDQDIAVDLARDFFEQTLSADDVKAELLRWQSGASSFDTFYYAMTKGGRTKPGVTAEEEHAAIEAEDQSKVTMAGAIVPGVVPPGEILPRPGTKPPPVKPPTKPPVAP